MNNRYPLSRILLYAYGNGGRGDDGLANALVEKIQPWLSERQFSFITTKSSIQLNVEDAEEISRFDIVVFIDASKKDIDDFVFTKVQPQHQSTFTTHAIFPSAVLHLCGELYGKQPETYLLHIKGYDWELHEGLSEQAEKNLWRAFHFFRLQLQEWLSVSELHM